MLRTTRYGRIGILAAFTAAVLAVGGLALGGSSDSAPAGDPGTKAGQTDVVPEAGAPDVETPAATSPRATPSAGSVRGLDAAERRKRMTPDEKVFQTAYKGGTQIVFRHKGHIEDYGLACIDCHHTESCSNCHRKQETPALVTEGKVALHDTCMKCHGETSGPTRCPECHKR